MAKKKSKRTSSTVKKSVVKVWLETAPYLPVPSMPAEGYMRRVDVFRVAYYEWLKTIEDSTA